MRIRALSFLASSKKEIQMFLFITLVTGYLDSISFLKYRISSEELIYVIIDYPIDFIETYKLYLSTSRNSEY